MVKLKNLLLEKTVRLSTMKDANFVPGEFVQIVGKKGMVKLDKKSVKYLAKWIRSNSGKHGMGWSFTEGKLNEEKTKFVVALTSGDVISGDKAVSEKKALQIMSRIAKQSDGWVNPFMIGVQYWNGTHPKRKGKPHKANKKKIMVKEEKLNEAKTLTLPNGVKAIIDFKGIKFKASKGAPVFLDRDELLKFFKGSTKYLRYT